MNKIDIKQLIKIAQEAGGLVLPIYNQISLEISYKDDNSVLTQADMTSHAFICDLLKRLYPIIPIISEESSYEYDFNARKTWKYFFLVDPLDGTKEFIQHNDEFTINIALIENNQPIMGIIHAPALGCTYYAEKNKGAYKISSNGVMRLPANCRKHDQIRVVVSKSHCCTDTKNFVATLQKKGKKVIEKSIGSALKFGLIAEGEADIYPRFSPTMEWDTAAGHILVNEVGKQVMLIDQNKPLEYNKLELKNSGFIVQ